MEMLNMPSHPRLGQRPSTKDHHRITGDLSCRNRTLHLEETDLTGEVLRCFVVRHVAHLECDGLEPSLKSFDFGDHVCQPEGREG